jgi:hypothetical protein
MRHTRTHVRQSVTSLRRRENFEEQKILSRDKRRKKELLSTLWS